MSITLNGTMGTAAKTVDYAKGGIGHAMSSGPATLFKGIRAAAGVVSVLRSFPLTPVLGMLSLVRRTGALGSVALFGAGVAVGAGVGILIAPVSGAEMRRQLQDRLKGLEGEAKRTLIDAEHKAEELAGKAKDSVVSAEHDLEHKVTDLVDDVKSVFISSNRYQHALRDSGNHKATNGAGNHHPAHTRN